MVFSYFHLFQNSWHLIARLHLLDFYIFQGFIIIKLYEQVKKEKLSSSSIPISAMVVETFIFQLSEQAQNSKTSYCNHFHGKFDIEKISFSHQK